MNLPQIYSTNEPTMGRIATQIFESATNGLYGLSFFTPAKDFRIPTNGFILPIGSIVQINPSANAVQLYEMFDARDMEAFRLRTGIITVNYLLNRLLYIINRQPSNKQLHSIGLIWENSNTKIYTNFGGLNGYNNFQDFLDDVIHMYPPAKQT